MASVTIRMDDEKRDELERLARERGTTVSEMLRLAVDGLLRRDVPQTLDMVARRQLVLSHEILVKLAQLTSDEDAEREHRAGMRVLSKGYRSEYATEFYSFDPELSPDDSALIMDLFDMFTTLETALGKLDEQDLAEVGEGDADSARDMLSFDGFDYQDSRESHLAGFAEYLIDDKRWPSLAVHFDDRPGGPQCPNSHSPRLGLYRRMLKAYQGVIKERSGPSGVGGLDTYRLGVAELKTVYAATRRPELPRW